MRKLLALVILLLVLVAVDQGARLFAEKKLEERTEASVPAAGAVKASITSFPFLGRLAVSGSIPKVRVRAEQTTLRRVLTARVEVDLRDVELSRQSLVRGKVRLQDIDRGTVAVELDARSLRRILRLPVVVEDGRVQVTVAGRSVSASASVEGGALVLAVAGLPAFNVPIGRNGLVSCTAANVVIEDDTVRLTCEVDKVPAVLRR